MQLIRIWTTAAMLLTAGASSAPRRPVMVTYPQDTPEAVLQSAKDAIILAVGCPLPDPDVAYPLILREERSPIILVCRTYTRRASQLIVPVLLRYLLPPPAQGLLSDMPRGFSALSTKETLDTVSALTTTYMPIIEEDQVVTALPIATQPQP